MHFIRQTALPYACDAWPMRRTSETRSISVGYSSISQYYQRTVKHGQREEIMSED